MNGLKTIVFSLIVVLFTSCANHYEYSLQYVYEDSTVVEVNKQVLIYGSGSDCSVMNFNNNHNVKVKDRSNKKLLDSYEIEHIKSVLLDKLGKPKEGLIYTDSNRDEIFIPFEEMDSDLKQLFFKLRKDKLND